MVYQRRMVAARPRPGDNTRDSDSNGGKGYAQPRKDGKRRNTDPGMNKNRIDPIARAKAARAAAILTNQGTVSSRGMRGDAGKGGYVRGGLRSDNLINVPTVPKKRKYRDGRDGKPQPTPGGGNRKKNVVQKSRTEYSGSTGRMGKGVR